MLIVKLICIFICAGYLPVQDSYLSHNFVWGSLLERKGNFKSQNSFKVKLFSAFFFSFLNVDYYLLTTALNAMQLKITGLHYYIRSIHYCFCSKGLHRFLYNQCCTFVQWYVFQLVFKATDQYIELTGKTGGHEGPVVDIDV